MDNINADAEIRIPPELAFFPGEDRQHVEARNAWLAQHRKAAKEAARTADIAPRVAALERDVKALAAVLVKVATAVEKAQKDAKTTRQALLDAQPAIAEKLMAFARKEAERTSRRAAAELEAEYAIALSRPPRPEPAKLSALEQRVSALAKQVSALERKTHNA
jgi:hypothetical protein